MIDRPLNGKPLVDPAGGGQTVAQCSAHVPRSRPLAGDEFFWQEVREMVCVKGGGTCQQPITW